MLFCVFRAEHHKVSLRRKHLYRYTRKRVTFMKCGFYSAFYRRFQHSSCHISARSDNKVGRKVVKYLFNTLSCAEIIMHSLNIQLYIMRCQLTLDTCHFYRCKIISRLFHKLCFKPVGRADKQYICIGKYFLQLIRYGKRRVYMSARTACGKCNIHILFLSQAVNQVFASLDILSSIPTSASCVSNALLP